MKRVMKASAAVVVAGAVLCVGYYLGAGSVDRTLYCGEYTQAYTTDSGEHLNGCELLPGYQAVKR